MSPDPITDSQALSKRAGSAPEVETWVRQAFPAASWLGAVPLLVLLFLLGGVVAFHLAMTRAGYPLAHELFWGLLACFTAVGLGLWFMAHWRRRQIQQAARYLRALESLQRISVGISAKLGERDEVLNELTEAAMHLLQADRAAITLLNAAGNRLDVAAYAGHRPAGARSSFPIEQLPASRKVIAGDGVMFIEDIQRVNFTFNFEIAREFDALSIILIPLRVADRLVGMMALSNRRPRRFSDFERRLARLVGSQATVILANNRLYEAARRDAETRATLLRELNHRVKNSLAGIVGLLSIDESALNPQARQWLARVTERVRTMARVHDLFSSGWEQVRLDQLIEQLLPSLSVVKPPEVHIHTDLDDVKAPLGTAQAVSLAMVLHELCVNAIVHGLGPQGELRIVARAGSPGRVILEVSDDGSGCGHRPSWSSPQGVGLQLVRQLVGRELQGNFELCRNESGGTVARIEFAAAPTATGE